MGPLATIGSNMNISPRLRVLLSLSVVWSSVAPAFAVEFETTGNAPRVITNPIAPISPIINPNLQQTLEVPQLPDVASKATLEATAVAEQTQAAQTARMLQATAQGAQTQRQTRAETLRASTSEKSFLGRVAQAVGSAILGRGSVTWTKIFDTAAPAGALGIRPLERPNLPDGFNLGEAPKTPDPKKVRTVNITANAIDAPGARRSGGIFDAGPRVLNAKATGSPEEIESSVKEALLKMVDADAAKWGVTRAELKEVHVRYVAGEGSQADTVYAYFRQQREVTTKNDDGTTTKSQVEVHGTALSFTVKIVKNQPILMAASAKLYPNLNVPTTATKTDQELKESAERQLPQNSGIQLVFAERRIVYHEGAWKAVNLYDIDGLPQAIGVRVAIDIASGEIFAWDSRVGMATVSSAEQGRFALAYRGIRPLSADEMTALKKLLAEAGMTISQDLQNANLLVVDGPVENMRKIVGNPIFQGWTIHRYDAPKMGYPEPSARLAAARKAAPAGAKLIGAAANFHNKSNVWAYRFYVPSANQVLEVYVNFKGDVHVTDARPAPSDTDFAEIDLDKILTLELAYKSALSLGAKPVGVRIERRQAMVGGHPVQFIFNDAGGKETLVPATAALGASFQGETAPDAAAVKGVFQARAEASDHRDADGKPILVVQATPHLKFTLDGTAGTADVDGKFSGNGKTVAATVESAWAKVKDTDRKELKVNATLDPDKPNAILLNPTQNDENAINQVNMLIWITRIHDWWSARLKGDKRIDKQIPVNVNIHQDCNAYYTPGRPSLNFFRSSEECSDTGKPGVGAHEYGHFVDDMIGGITNGGMSEGWGDIGSMFLLNTPIIGEGFLKHRDPSWIRHGENTYQYNENDEVHDQGQAWMGFAWKLRKALIAALGEAAGAAEAEALIVPTLFAKASDIPAQMAQVLLAGMDRDGNIRYEKEIRAAAKAHGIDLPKNPGIVGGIADAANGFVGLIVGGSGVSVEEIASGTFNADANALVPENFGRPAGEVVTKTFSLKAGRQTRDEIREKLAGAYKYRSGEYHDLGFQLDESKGWRGSEFRVTITGSAKSVEYMTKQISRIGGKKEAASEGEKPATGLGPVGIRAPQPANPIGDAAVTQHLDEAASMSTAWERNKVIEDFYKRFAPRLTPTQVERLMGGLAYNSYDSWTIDAVSYRVADAYFASRPASLDLGAALSLAKRMSNGWQTNRLLEVYFTNNSRALDAAQVSRLLDGLVYNSYNSWTIGAVAARVADAYFALNDDSLDVPAAIGLAKKMQDGWKTNSLIEVYYKNNRDSLRWPQVKTLIESLVYNSYNSWTIGAVKDRILRDWETVAHENVAGDRLRFGAQPETPGAGPALSLASDAATPAPEISTWKDEIEVGRLLRARFKSEFIRYCERNDLKYSITEDRHVLSSTFYIRVEGPKDKVWALYEWVKSLESGN